MLESKNKFEEFDFDAWEKTYNKENNVNFILDYTAQDAVLTAVQACASFYERQIGLTMRCDNCRHYGIKMPEVTSHCLFDTAKTLTTRKTKPFYCCDNWKNNKGV